MAAIFNNKWIYTLDFTGDLKLLEKKVLPSTWTNPVDGSNSSNFHTYPESYLNSVGWYRVLEDIPIITNYETTTLSTRVYDSVNKYFTDVLIANYLPIEEIRHKKKLEVSSAKMNNIRAKLDNKTSDEKFISIYRSLSLLIQAFSETNPAIFVNNQTFLQNVMAKANTLNSETDVYNTRLAQIEIETDIATLIAI